jgi:glyoxylase-like metal-dependent hydrolase (beta-lactamase superfamily II)
MAKIFRGLPEAQLTRLAENLALLEHSDPGAVGAHMSTNAYAILIRGRALFFDVNASALLPLVEILRRDGFEPAGLVLSHRHSAGLGDAVITIAEQYQTPVFLHPIDAQHPQAMAVGLPYENPVGHPLLAEFGTEALHFPGHTAGLVTLYLAAQQVLLAADAAMGPTAPQADRGIEYLIRPPITTNVDDDEFRRRWLVFDRPVASVLPYHGTGYIQRRRDLPTIMQSLTRQVPTMGLTG